MNLQSTGSERRSRNDIEEAPIPKKRRVSRKSHQETHDIRRNVQDMLTDSAQLGALSPKNEDTSPPRSPPDETSFQKLDLLVQATDAAVKRKSLDLVATAKSEENSNQEPSADQKKTHIPNSAIARGAATKKGASAAKRRVKSFVLKLHDLLADEEIKDIVAWIPDGEAFAIMSRERFVTEVLPRYFKEAKFESFARKLNRWGFRRISPENKMYRGCFVYHHKHFKRDSPELSKAMSGGKRPEVTRSHGSVSDHGAPANFQTDTYGILTSNVARAQVTDSRTGLPTTPTIQSLYSTSFAGTQMMQPAPSQAPPQISHRLGAAAHTPFERYLLQQQVSYAAEEQARVLQMRAALGRELELRNQVLATAAATQPPVSPANMSDEELILWQMQLCRRARARQNRHFGGSLP